MKKEKKNYKIEWINMVMLILKVMLKMNKLKMNNNILKIKKL